MAKKYADPIEMTCAVTAVVHSSPSQFNETKHFTILAGRNEEKGGFKLLGEADSGAFMPGCEYRFSGNWDVDARSGDPIFRYKVFAVRHPVSRNGVIAYLSKYAPNLGVITSGKICDAFGPVDAVRILRTDPQRVATAIGMNVDRVTEASAEMRKMVETEETRIQLMDLFKGRRFRETMYGELMRDFGVSAPQVVKDRPFVLLERHYTGCGFLTVDEFYMSLGHDPASITRQVHAVTHVLDRLADGSTWCRYQEVKTEVGKLVTSGLRFEECIENAIKLHYIKSRTENGEMWFAHTRHADTEISIAQLLIDIAGKDLINPNTSEMDERDEKNALHSLGKNPLDDLFDDDDEDESDAIPSQDAVDIGFSDLMGEEYPRTISLGDEREEGINIADILEDAFSIIGPQDLVITSVSPVEDNLPPFESGSFLEKTGANRDIRDAKLTAAPAAPVAPKIKPVQNDDDDSGMEFTTSAVGLDSGLGIANKLIEELDLLTEEMQEMDLGHRGNACTEDLIQSLAGISTTILKSKRATDKQINALRTMIAVGEKWIKIGNDKADKWSSNHRNDTEDCPF